MGEVSDPVAVAVGACAMCGSTDARRWREVRGHAYVECGECRTVRLAVMPSGSELRDLYGDDYFLGSSAAGYSDYEADREIHRRNARRHLDRIESHGATPPGRLVDVGCAAGFLLEMAAERGWDVHGVEVSDRMREVAARRAGCEVVATLDDLDLADGTADVVVMNQVLEHMPDPFDALRSAGRLLRPGGLLSIETWDRSSAIARIFGSRWQQISPPWVVWLFGRRDLISALDRAGFEVVRFRWSAKLVSVDTVVGQLATRGRAGAVLARGASALGLRRLAVPYAAGDLVVAVAHRRAHDADRSGYTVNGGDGR